MLKKILTLGVLARVTEAAVWIFGIAGAAVLTFFNQYWPQYSALVSSAAIGFASFFVVAAVHRLLKFTNERSLPSDLAGLIRDWSDGIATSVATNPKNGNEFAYTLLMHGDIRVNVIREDNSKSLVITAGLNVGDVFGAMNEPKRRVLVIEMSVEMSKLNMVWAGFIDSPTKLEVARYLPITSELNEYRFSTEVRMVQNAVILLRQLVLRSRLTQVGQ